MRWLPFLALIGCGGDPAAEDTGDPAPGDPPVDYAERGPYPVGTETLSVAGTDGLELTVQVWYPAAEEGGAPISYDGLLPGDAYEGVEADCASARPLLAFSHGYGGVRYQSPFFTEHLASHGYVVVAPDHVGNTLLDIGGDFQELVLRRPVDVADSVDAILALSADGASPYAGCLDAAAGYAVAGHSFGGYTALAAAGATVNDLMGGTVDLGDDRVWAAVPLAPWDAGGALTDGTSAIAAPTMILTGERDDTTPIGQVRDLWEPLTVQPRYLGVFPDAGHYSFSPVACVLEDGDGCGAGYLDEATFTARVNEAALAFLEGVRTGAPSAFEAIPLDAPEIDWESAR